MGTVVEFAKFSSQPDKSLSKETPVPLENVPLENKTGGIYTAELEADCANLAAMGLRKKYPYEAGVHTSRKSQCKGQFKFKDFRSFLGSVGICPHPHDWTLDRIDNKNPDYGPGLVRWASKKVQTRNRSITVVLTVDGVSKPLAEWAESTGQKYDALRKRYQRELKRCPHDLIDHRKIVYGTPPAARDSVESEWRELLPERMWSQWERFEQGTAVDGNHVPRCFIGASPEFISQFSAGPRGRALRLYSTAGRYLDDLNEQIADAQACAEQYGDPEPDEKLLKAHAFWTEARERARFALFGESR